MPDRHNEPDWANQPTEVMPAIGRHRVGQTGDQTADQTGDRTGDQTGDKPSAAAGTPGGPDGGRQPGGNRWVSLAKRRWMIPTAALGVLLLAYLVDLAATRGDMPRGVQVSGVALGGLTQAAAQQTLIAELTPDLR
ncbi:MAG: hypothetical protein QOI68_821, partial [Pseudonocardiales bacterium]|nr:hypothetical protein [Pseudonocardiales bacterium]